MKRTRLVTSNKALKHKQNLTFLQSVHHSRILAPITKADVIDGSHAELILLTGLQLQYFHLIDGPVDIQHGWHAIFVRLPARLVSVVL